VCRDRGGYGEAAAKALPDAVQVADRWHLMENASAAFLGAVRKSMRAIRGAIGATIDLFHRWAAVNCTRAARCCAPTSARGLRLAIAERGR
jgi:hypothetical protein